MGRSPERTERAVDTARPVGPGRLLDLPGEALTERLTSSRRTENLLAYERLQVIAALWRAWSPDDEQRALDRRAGRRTLAREALRDDLVVTEVAAALGLSEYAAGQRVDAAVALLVDHRLPLADTLAAAGELDWGRLNALLTRTRDLTVDQARAVEARVLTPSVRSLTIGRFMDAVDRAVLAVDPDAAARRRKGTVEGRRVSLWKDRDGFDDASGRASLAATGPADALSAAMACLDAAARWLREQGDPRTLDQLRHDLLVTGCTTGSLPVPQTALPTTPPTAADDTPAHSQETTVVRVSPRPPVRAEIVVLVTAQTLAGLNDEPAHLHGYGPITADMARDLARNGIWRCAAVDDTHATVLGVGRTTWTPGYVPGKALRDFLAVAARTCIVPWCTVPIDRCDLDHRTPYTSGGATCSCQVAPLCRTHHREKTAGDLTLQTSTDHAHPAGSIILTTKGGQRFVLILDAPLPPEAYKVEATPGTPHTTETTRTTRTPGTPTTAATDDTPPY